MIIEEIYHFPDFLMDTVSAAAKALKSTSAKTIRSSEWLEVEGIL